MKKIKRNKNNSTDFTVKSSSSESLPTYSAPPVNEVVCGIRFNPPDQLRITHIGMLWEKFRETFPIVQHAAPIASAKGELLVDPATGLPIQRVWFINASDDELIQFQFNRFYFNWRQRNNSYPRYDYVIGKFEYIKSTIIDFFKEFELGEFSPIECEISYINHIPKGQGWETPDELSAIFSDFTWKGGSERFLPNPEKFAWTAEFPLKENMGRLSISVKHGTRAEDKVPLIILELRAICSCELIGSDLRSWFDLAHEWIVRGFTDITSSNAHKMWQREL